MGDGITHAGLDAHQETIVAAVLRPGAQQPVEDRFANTPEAVARSVRRLRSRSSGEVICAYEAGPLGYGLMRQLEALGVSCVVVAPALIPIKPGDRIKTDRRDARKLAELLRAGLLTPVHAPTPEQEAVATLDDHLLALEQLRSSPRSRTRRRGRSRWDGCAASAASTR